LRRTGHTEAAIDFARFAGIKAAGVIVEIMNEDGTMARLPQLYKVCKKFGSKNSLDRRFSSLSNATR
jgi:3,4-dihydroxy 2-butanone 4-phosphate synthase/GTP cyclohydrolase II